MIAFKVDFKSQKPIHRLTES